MGLPRRLRLREAGRIREVMAHGRRVATPFGVVHVLPGETAHSRLCTAFARRVGNAVARNRGRRRVQELFRGWEPRWRGAWDVVFRARRDIVAADGHALAGALEELMMRAGALEAVSDGR
jgi:ribonuclease P protein component